MTNAWSISIFRNRLDKPWSYGDLDRLQRSIADEILHTDREGALLFSELAPVITLGRRGNSERAGLKATPEFYQREGIAILETARGGWATYHGPGQWVVFLVDRLERLTGDRRGLRSYVDGLMSACLRVAKVYDSSAYLGCGSQLGVWGSRGKIASVGIEIQSGITLHGVAFNALQTPQSFLGLNPCGLAEPIQYVLDSATTQMEAERRFLTLRTELEEAIQLEFSVVPAKILD